MNLRGTLYLNKNIKRRQEQRVMQNHISHLRSIRPVTSNLESFDPIPINNKKKQMQIENRFTQIERENRILLQKITGIMNKKKSLGSTQQINRSLNSSIRKKNLQDIQTENAKMLKRLQQKKPTYDTQKLKKQWKKQKNVIKNLANFPQIFNETKRPHRRTSLSTNLNLGSDIQICRVRIIDGTSFLVTVRLSKNKLQIVGDSKNKKQIKIIQIEREEAIDFIDSECEGNIEKIFQRLRYDKAQQILYLVGEDVDIKKDNPQSVKESENIELPTQFKSKEQPQQKKKQWVEVKEKDQI